MIAAIAAIDSQLGMANDQGIPWQGLLPSDVKYFRNQTKGGLVVMGYGTYQEFASPLKDRQNFVVSRDSSPLRPGFSPITNLATFIAEHRSDPVWIIGGPGLLAQSLRYIDKLYLTRLAADFKCTKFFPPFKDSFYLLSTSPPQTENGLSFQFEVWQRN